MTIVEALRAGAERLETSSVPDAAYDAQVLMEHVTGLSRTRLLAEQNEELSGEKETEFFELISKRSERVPLQHLTHVQDFMGLPIYVDERVLCPRLDTEVLAMEVRRILDMIYKNGGLSDLPGNVVPLRHDVYHDIEIDVLDLCTGSGCVAISIADHGKKRGYNLSISAVDRSEDALTVAKKNADALGAGIRFFSGDLYEPVKDRRFHVITANPPYIATKYLEELMPEVRDHEPRMALDGGEDGLIYYRRITSEAHDHLYEGGWLLYEIGFDQGEDVKNI
ncbi:MAG: peptide chain release factor N(5)-glutamine methyltransferase, partial [Lachnospiraceae bacterium]|nr:peptide chain release factor N(5)-glutamine methyltransferase [Lachnospiraceae bacterium]